MMTNCVPKILVVDSEPNWTAQVETILERQGRYQVEVTTSLDHALDYPYINGFHLILVNSEIALSGDGAKFRQLVSRYPDKVLVVSDVRSITTAIRVFKLGADYAEKPFEASRLLKLVSSHLRPQQVSM